jgi:hypothetical protein
MESRERNCVAAVCIVRVSLRSHPDGPTTVRDRQRQADLAPKSRRERLKEGGELPKRGKKREKLLGKERILCYFDSTTIRGGIGDKMACSAG